MSEHLPLVVAGAAGVDIAIAHGRFERRADPLIQWVGRLHVVMAVNQCHRRIGYRRRLGVDDRKAGCFD